MNEQLHVCDFGIKIIMLQVAPGTETEVASFFSNELRRLCRKFRIFKALGNYDLLIGYESPDFTPDVIDIGTIPHILKSNELLCFPWEIKNEAGTTVKEGLNFKNFEKNIVGLSFLKINPISLIKAGAKVEQSLISFCKTQDNISILGSFGWNEILILVHGETIEKTYKSLLQISNLQIGHESGENNNIIEWESCFLKTLSFLGISFDLIEKTNVDPNSLRNNLTENITKACFPQLYITCCPEHMRDIMADAANIFGQPTTVIGAEDLCISEIKKQKTWGDFLTEIINFRLRNKLNLFSTSVRIHRKATVDKKSSEASNKVSTLKLSSPPINISGEDALKLCDKFGRTFQMLLLNTIYTFNNILGNNIARDAFIDMIPFANYIKEIALSDESTSQEIGIYIDHFIYGAQQRATSTYSGIDNIDYGFATFKGGIQRVLQAIEIIPKSMLRNIGLEWKGIINAGEYNSYRSDIQVLNIPLESLFIPKSWWGLFHETGHVATLSGNLLDLKDKTMEELAGKKIGISKDHAEYPDFVDLCWEISADIFDFKFGFLNDISTYYKVLWEYLEEYVKVRDISERKKEKYVLRSFYVYLYDRIVNEDCKFESIDNNTIESYFKEFIDFLNGIKKQNALPEIQVSKKTQDKIILTSLSFRNILLHLSKKYSTIARYDDQISTDTMEEIDRIIDTLKKGQIYWKEIKHPEIIIYRFKKEDITGLKINTATILSFWNTFHLRYGSDFYNVTGSRESSLEF